MASDLQVSAVQTRLPEPGWEHWTADFHLRHGVAADTPYRTAQNQANGEPGLTVKPDPKTAFKLFLIAANAGMSAAQYEVALAYIEGNGVTRNEKRGLQWLTLAAHKRYVPSLMLFGDLYLEGRIVTQDTAAALKWYRLAMASPCAQYKAEYLGQLDETYAQAGPQQRAEVEALIRKWAAEHPIREDRRLCS